jgi:hypothetical protein
VTSDQPHLRVPASQLWLSLALVIAGTLVVPLGLRAVNLGIPGGRVQPSYMPGVDAARPRYPFDGGVVLTLQRNTPDYVVIGDSMAGTRVAPYHLSKLVGGHGVASLLWPGIGSAYWYLVFKNYVVEGGIKPRAAIFFFRDENLTDPLFRVNPAALDRAAHDREPELNRILAANTHGAFYRVHGAAQALYQFDRTRVWLEPLLANAPVRFAVKPGGRWGFLQRMNDTLFSLDTLRPMAAADMAVAQDSALDFNARLPLSFLPELFRLSKSSGIRLAFIRIQRRPTADGPPKQSAALERYVSALEIYLRTNGAYFHDDWGDPDQPLKIYEDGDHIDRNYRLHYTELFFRKNRAIFQ